MFKFFQNLFKKKAVEVVEQVPDIRKKIRRIKRSRIILGLNKKNCDEILLKKGFYKHSEPYSYSKWRNKNERIHIKLEKCGFCYHIDHH